MNTWLNNIKTLAWDLDGTLYPATPKMNEAITQRLLTLIAKTRSCSLEEAEAYYQDQKNILKSSTRVLDKLGLDGQQFFLDVWAELPLGEFIEPNPTLAQLFNQAGRLQHIMHTNSNSQQTVARKLACLGLSPNLFSVILTSGEMRAHKPDQKAFEILLETAGNQPEEILYLGDRVEVDLIPAKKIGLRTCLIGSDQPANPNQEVDLFFPTPELALAEILKIQSLAN